MSPAPRRSGVTLIELVIVVSILGVIAAVAVPTVRHRELPAPDSPQLRAVIARRKALATGMAVTVEWSLDSGVARKLTAWPDGRVSADSLPSIELMTGMLDKDSSRSAP